MTSPKNIARTYFDFWTQGRFTQAASLLAEGVVIDTPINAYPEKADFVAALESFGALVERTDNLIEIAEGDSVVQIYDMDVAGLGSLRIAEHFIVRDGVIIQLRQIHDTAALCAAGFVRR